MSLIKKPHEIETPSCLRILIYGQPGIGKTTLALSAPSPLLLDFDHGAHRIREIDRADTVSVESWDNVSDVLSGDLSAYQSIVVDTAGKLLDYMAADIIAQDPKMGKRDGALALQGFGARKERFRSFISRLTAMGKHVIFVAHDREEKNGDDRIIRPEIGGSSGGDLIKEIDLVGYMEASGKNRTISFDPCEKFYGKNTCGLDSIIKLPDLSKPNDFIQQIAKAHQGRAAERMAVAGRYATLMETIRHNIEVMAGPDDAQSVAEFLKGAEKIWDSNIQAQQLFRARLADLNLKWDVKAAAFTSTVQQPEMAMS